MCFSPKIKTPKVNPSSIRAVDPAPLTEEPKGVLFGGDDEDDNNNNGTSSEVSTGRGRSSLKIKIDKSIINSKRDTSNGGSSKGKTNRNNKRR